MIYNELHCIGWTGHMCTWSSFLSSSVAGRVADAQIGSTWDMTDGKKWLQSVQVLVASDGVMSL
jgi:hypothetical protein